MTRVEPIARWPKVRRLTRLTPVLLSSLVGACASAPVATQLGRQTQSSAQAILLEASDVWPGATDVVVSTDEQRTIDEIAADSQSPSEARRRSLKESYSRVL